MVYLSYFFIFDLVPLLIFTDIYFNMNIVRILNEMNKNYLEIVHFASF